MGGDGFETVHLAADPAEGEMIVGALQGEGIAARLVRVSSALIGVAPHIFEIKVQVPPEFAARAREMIGELEHVGTLEAFDARAPGIGAPEEDPASPASPRRPVLGAGIAFLLPGGGHFYARRPWTAIVLEAGMLACLAILTIDRESNLAANAVFATVFSIVVCDSVGSLLAVRGAVPGAPAASQQRQVGRGLVLLLIAGAAGTVFGAAAQVPHWVSARQLRQFVATCEHGGIAVENRGPVTRSVVFARVFMTAPDGRGAATAPLSFDGGVYVSLAPGARGSVRYTVPDEVARACERLLETRGARCAIAFRFDVLAADGDATAFTAGGVCPGGWDEPAPAAPARLGLPVRLSLIDASAP